MGEATRLGSQPPPASESLELPRAWPSGPFRSPALSGPCCPDTRLVLRFQHPVCPPAPPRGSERGLNTHHGGVLPPTGHGGGGAGGGLQLGRRRATQATEEPCVTPTATSGLSRGARDAPGRAPKVCSPAAPAGPVPPHLHAGRFPSRGQTAPCSAAPTASSGVRGSGRRHAHRQHGRTGGGNTPVTSEEEARPRSLPGPASLKVRSHSPGGSPSPFIGERLGVHIKCDEKANLRRHLMYNQGPPYCWRG